jgi:hypothetical protein
MFGFADHFSSLSCMLHAQPISLSISWLS